MSISTLAFSVTSRAAAAKISPATTSAAIASPVVDAGVDREEPDQDGEPSRAMSPAK